MTNYKHKKNIFKEQETINIQESSPSFFMRNKAPPTNTSVVERCSGMELLKFINGNGDGDGEKLL